MACHFNQDYDVIYGSLEKAIVATTKSGPLEYRRSLLKEWRDWNMSEGAVEDIRLALDDSFAIDIYFSRPIDAKNFMNRIYDVLIESVRAETSRDKS
ncbi:MAG: hypothetical protein DI568_13955 [Sphingomonas sp.]|nr:MAG: hypothetical protein DI568_13955 [Sphingomonas sp.]